MKVIKDINFLPDYVLHKQKNAKRSAVIVAWTFICVVIGIGIYILPIQIYNYYSTKSNDYRVQLSKLSYVQQKVNQLEALRLNKDKKRLILAKIDSKQVRVVENIDKINSSIPPDVTLKSCIFSSKSINANFIVNSPTEVVDLLARLEKLNISSKISISSTPIVDENSTVNIKMELK